nr:hypothetical protein [Mycoplasmopsis bovis]
MSRLKWLSDLAKPFGVKFIENNADLESQIWPLNIKKYYGIGEKTADKLVKADVKTIGNLARSKWIESWIVYDIQKQTVIFY